MNWTETNPFLTFFYPFYNLPLALRPQDHCFSLPYPFLSQNDSEAKECIKNLKNFDTQPNLSSEKLDLRAAPELRKKAIRKQKILKRRVRSFWRRNARITLKEKSRRKTATCPPTYSNTSSLTSTPFPPSTTWQPHSAAPPFPSALSASSAKSKQQSSNRKAISVRQWSRGFTTGAAWARERVWPFESCWSVFCCSTCPFSSPRCKSTRSGSDENWSI